MSEELWNWNIVANFSDTFLKKQYDDPKPTPILHDELWRMYCSEEPWVAFAAPRGHAKTSAGTHAFGICAGCFRWRQFILIVSDTEGQACEFLGDMKREFLENKDLRKAFMVKRIVKDTETDLIVECTDGYQFRYSAKGSNQKVRGMKWRNKRPDLVLGDDLENDELVMTPERREKFRKWFFSALVPCVADGGLIRVAGTILHLDSLLNRLMENPEWYTARYAAHNPDFTEIAWPEKFPKEKLQRIRASYEAENDLEGYFKEYLNWPIAEGATYFRPQDFQEMDDPDYESPKVYYAAADFAISEKEKADYTVMMVAGVDSEGMIHVVDVRRFRGDADDIIEELLTVQKRWSPEVFVFETEKVDKAIGPSLNRAMMRTGIFLNIEKMTPSKSKTTRAKSIQRAMKSGACKFDKKAEWYQALHDELMTVSATEGPKGKHDDHFDAFAYIGLALDQFREAQTPDEIEQEEYEYEVEQFFDFGANKVTGY